jgi:hypothetical protein
VGPEQTDLHRLPGEHRRFGGRTRRDRLSRTKLTKATFQWTMGLPEVAGNVWPRAIVQTCIIDLIRNIFRLASKKD